MGNKLNWHKLEDIASNAKALQDAAQILATLAAKMQERGDSEIPIPWNKRQDDCISVLVDTCDLVKSKSNSFFLAKGQNRKTPQEEVIERRSLIKAKQAESSPVKKSPGRPRKNVE